MLVISFKTASYAIQYFENIQTFRCSIGSSLNGLPDGNTEYDEECQQRVHREAQVPVHRLELAVQVW
jgi:hypothetical protein